MAEQTTATAPTPIKGGAPKQPDAANTPATPASSTSATATSEAPTAPSTPAAPPTAEERKTQLDADIKGFEQQISKWTKTAGVLRKSAGEDEDLQESLKEAEARIEKATKARDAAVKEREGVDKEEQMKSVAAPFLAAFGTAKIENAALLPETIHLVDIGKMKNDAQVAAQKAIVVLEFIKAAEAAAKGLDENIVADLPPLSLDRNGNEVKVKFAERRRTRSTSTDGATSDGPRASSKPRRIVKSSEASHVGWVIGKADNANYPSWQAVFDELADEETKKRMENQSRNKREWYERQFKAETIEI